jgi:hypothetical protein
MLDCRGRGPLSSRAVVAVESLEAGQRQGRRHSLNALSSVIGALGRIMLLQRDTIIATNSFWSCLLVASWPDGPRWGQPTVTLVGDAFLSILTMCYTWRDVYLS